MAADPALGPDSAGEGPEPANPNGRVGGLGLLPQHATMLALSAIDAGVARERGYRSITSTNDLRQLGFSAAQQRVPGLLVPIHGVDGRVALHQLRPDAPRERKGKAVKYETLAGARMCLDAHPRIRPMLADPSRPLWVTEGVKKADAAVSLGLCCIGLLGVFCWRGKNALGAVTALGDWESIALKGRKVFIAFDSDAAQKKTVALALQRLKQFLESRGADVSVVYLSDGDGGQKVGLDDFIAAGGREADLIKLASRTLRQPAAPPAPTIDPDCPYVETPSGLTLITQGKAGPVERTLTNFTARVVANIIEDDGVQQQRAVELIATMAGQERLVHTSMADFNSLRWVPEHLGAEAIVHPRFYVRDHVRVAIQTFSGTPAERVVYSHTGWRKFQSGWMYLHAGGAIDEAGPVDDVEVELPDDLSRFRVRCPPDGAELVEAVRTALKLLDLAPKEIIVPLLGLVWRVAIGGTDFGFHLVGRTGTFKSELAALMQQFWGLGMDARHLPASWLSTGNSLEALCFAAKDAILVVDDFAPRGSTSDVQRFHREADRLFRAQGNRAGRQRMNAEGSMRQTHPPRGAILSTGEEVPQGHSLQARVMVLEVAPKSIRSARLSAAQRDAASGAYSAALAGYIRWLAPRYEAIVERVAALVIDYRDGAVIEGGHRRTLEIVANLLAGWKIFLEFAVDVRVMNADEAAQLFEAIRVALNSAGQSQVAGQSSEETAERFIALLRSAISSGRCHVADAEGQPPRNAGAWGWHRRSSLNPFYGEHWDGRGNRIGWLDGEDLYLDCGAAHAAAKQIARDQGEPLPVTQRTLHKRLAEGGHLETTGGVRGAPVRKTLEGQIREVLHLKLRTLFLLETDQTDQRP